MKKLAASAALAAALAGAVLGAAAPASADLGHHIWVQDIQQQAKATPTHAVGNGR
jgi:hypothetical protein